MDKTGEFYVMEFTRNACLFISIFGIVGNVLLIIVFSRDKLKKTSFSIYFQALAIIDILNLYPLILYYAILMFNIRLTSSIFGCKFFNSVPFLTQGASSWLLTQISLDRAINIIFPKRFLFLTKKKSNLALSDSFFYTIFYLAFQHGSILFNTQSTVLIILRILPSRNRYAGEKIQELLVLPI